jgi:LacI family transcriptional regulator
MFSSAREEAKRLNFTLELFLVGPAQLSPTRLSQVLHARGITGILLGALSPTTRTLNIDWSRFCVIGIESTHVEPRVDNVSADYRQAARVALRQLRDRGLGNVGFLVAQDLGAEVDGQLRAGYLVESHARTPSRISPFCHLDAETGEVESLLQWIRTEKLDAVVGCGVDISGLVARTQPDPARGLTWASIDIGHAQSEYPCVSGLHRDLGRRAVELLVSRLQINLRGVPANPATTLFPVEWRESEKKS